MSEVKKIATRASYGAALVELGKEHEDLVVLDADLAAATQTGMFKKEFPERHIDCGIAFVINDRMETNDIAFFEGGCVTFFDKDQVSCTECRCHGI